MTETKNPVGRPKGEPTKNITFRVPLKWRSELMDFVREKIKEFMILKNK